MQLLFLPEWLMILSFFIAWPLLQVSCALIGNSIPDETFNPESFWFKTRRWERWLYEKVFKIKLWKKFLPDGARLFAKGFEKGKLKSIDTGYLGAFVAETCRAELIHWLQIVPFWVFGFWAPPVVIWAMLGYASIVNLPCIIAQRYNRPRIKVLLRVVVKASNY